MILNSRSYSEGISDEIKQWADQLPAPCEVKLPAYKKTINHLIDAVHECQNESASKDKRIVRLLKDYDQLASKAKEGPSFDYETAAIMLLSGTVLGFIGAKVIK